ncbi:MAG: hypothetical protein SGPRY_004788 [Prymnesium sp.]
MHPNAMLPVVLGMKDDPVPNIRFNVAKTLQSLLSQLDGSVVNSQVEPPATRGGTSEPAHRGESLTEEGGEEAEENSDTWSEAREAGTQEQGRHAPRLQ